MCPIPTTATTCISISNKTLKQEQTPTPHRDRKQYTYEEDDDDANVDCWVTCNMLYARRMCILFLVHWNKDYYDYEDYDELTMTNQQQLHPHTEQTIWWWW